MFMDKYKSSKLVPKTMPKGETRNSLTKNIYHNSKDMRIGFFTQRK